MKNRRCGNFLAFRHATARPGHPDKHRAASDFPDKMGTTNVYWAMMR
jgi:hypothetical protein